MFCMKCGSPMPDDAAFCPRCGAPTPSPQSENAPASSGISPQIAPEMPNANASLPKGIPSGAPSTPSQNTPAPQKAAEIPGGQKRGIDKGKVFRDIALAAPKGFLIGALFLLAMTLIFNGAKIGPFGDDRFFNGSIWSKILILCGIVLIGALFCGLLSVVPKAIIIMRRIKDPEDTAYEIGSTQDPMTNASFSKKYQKMESIAETALWIATPCVAICLFFLGLYIIKPREMQTLWNHPDGSSESSYTSSESSSSSDYGQGHQTPETSSEDSSEDDSASSYFVGTQLKVSTTLYFDDREMGSTIILEPDGTCAYLAEYATESVYYYGNYQLTEEGIDLHLDSDNSKYDIPLAYNNGLLTYIGTESEICFYSGAVYHESVEAPESVRLNPPYEERQAVSSATYYQADSEIGEITRAVENIPTLILESDNTCALLATIDGRPIYLYGTYEIVSTGVKLRLTDVDGSIFYLSATNAANGLDFPDGYSRLGLFQYGERFYVADGVPKSVQVHPPYSDTPGDSKPKTVSETTYYYVEPEYDDEIAFAPALILEPDSTCTFLGNFDSGMVYLYGQYEMSLDGVILHLNVNGNIYDSLMKNTAYGLEYASNEGWGYTVSQGTQFIHCNEMPPSVAREDLVLFLLALPDELQPPPSGEPEDIWPYYEETVTIDGQTHYLFQEDNFDPGNGDRMAVNAQTGELLGIYIEGNTAYTMPLEEWINGYFALGIDPWNDSAS